MMTKKDFEKAAKLVRYYRACKINEGEAARVAQAFGRFFSDDNPRFDKERFFAACEPRANEWFE